jgi:hypothetical protein
MALVGFKAKNHPQQTRYAGSAKHVDDRALPASDFAKLNAKLAQDPAYWEILKKGSPLWVEGSMKDRIVSLM